MCVEQEEGLIIWVLVGELNIYKKKQTQKIKRHLGGSVG